MTCWWGWGLSFKYIKPWGDTVPGSWKPTSGWGDIQRKQTKQCREVAPGKHADTIGCLGIWETPNRWECQVGTIVIGVARTVSLWPLLNTLYRTEVTLLQRTRLSGQPLPHGLAQPKVRSGIWLQGNCFPPTLTLQTVSRNIQVRPGVLLYLEPGAHAQTVPDTEKPATTNQLRQTSWEMTLHPHPHVPRPGDDWRLVSL